MLIDRRGGGGWGGCRRRDMKGIHGDIQMSCPRLVLHHPSDFSGLATPRTKLGSFSHGGPP